MDVGGVEGDDMVYGFFFVYGCFFCVDFLECKYLMFILLMRLVVVLWLFD